MKRVTAAILVCVMICGFSSFVLTLSFAGFTSNTLDDATRLGKADNSSSGGRMSKNNVTEDKKISSYSEAEYELLARVISAEARGEPYLGQVAVGAVILNRIEHPSFPDTLEGVVYQRGAFSCMTDGQINIKITDSAYKAALDAINGLDPSMGAIYYYNPETATSDWIYTRPMITQIGAHVFCR